MVIKNKLDFKAEKMRKLIIKRGLIIFLLAILTGNVYAQNEFLQKLSDNELIILLNSLITAPENSELELEYKNELFRRFDLKGGETPYHYIAESGKLEFLDLHKSFFSSYSVNAITEREEETPIHYAASYNDNNPVKTIEALKKRGANIFAVDKYGKNALHIATNKNKTDVVKYTCEQGLNVSDTTHKGRTALYFAVRNENKEIVDYLLSEGAKIKANRIEEIIICVAAYNNWFDIVDLALSEGVEINLSPIRKWPISYIISENIIERYSSPLLAAVYNNKTKMLEHLIEKGADINAYEPIFGYSALTIAIRNDYKEVFDIIIQQNPDVNIPTPFITTFPIYHCFYDGISRESGQYYAKAILANDNYIAPYSDEALGILDKMFHNLTNSRLKVRFSGGDGEIDEYKLKTTPLHTAAFYNQDEICKILIEKGTDVNIPDKWSGTIPILTAANQKSYEAAKVLMELGADPKIKNEHGENALKIANEKKDEKMKLILKGK
jgi:ankyrin repeat protein